MTERRHATLLAPVLDLCQRGDPGTALGLCDAIAQDHPDCADAFALLAELLQRAGDPCRAVMPMRRAYDLEPARFHAAMVQAQAAVTLTHAQTDSPYDLLRDLRCLLELKAVDEAEAVFHFLLERHRADPAIAQGVRMLLQRHGRNDLLSRWGAVSPNAVLVLPDRPVRAAELARFVKSIRQNLGIGAIALTRRGGHTPAEAAPDACVFVPYAEERLICYSHVIYVEDAGDQEAASAMARQRPQVYRLDQTRPGYEARLLPAGRGAEAGDYPFISSHVFNRVTQHLYEHYYFFPYGYLYRYLGFGPVNAFGHRIDHDLEALKTRPARHKLIVCFGGSSCFSMFCLHDEMFSSRLEAKLNDWAASEERDLEFTVLNFGQHGNVVLNELTTYLLFVQSLRPDVVLAHDGFNDLMYGQFADPFLVGSQQIVYQDNLEDWGAILHGNKADLPADRYLDGIRHICNTPINVVDAYIARLNQFAGVVLAGGSRFVWGLQPWLGSKRAPTQAEAGYLRETLDGAGQYRDGYRNLPFLYDGLRQRSGELRVSECVDLHAAFQGLGRDVDHFHDIVHLSPAGDEAVASVYLPALKRLFDGAPQ